MSPGRIDTGPDGLELVTRRAEAISELALEERDREILHLLDQADGAPERAAVLRVLPAGSATPGLVARLAQEVDAEAIPAAAAWLARVPGEAASDALARLVARTGPEDYPDLVCEVLDRDEEVSVAALVTLARANSRPEARSERERILDRLPADLADPASLKAWAESEPDSDLRERIEDQIRGR